MKGRTSVMTMMTMTGRKKKKKFKRNRQQKRMVNRRLLNLQSNNKRGRRKLANPN